MRFHYHINFLLLSTFCLLYFLSLHKSLVYQPFTYDDDDDDDDDDKLFLWYG